MSNPRCGISISYQKSRLSDSNSAEFAKRFRVRSLTVDLSPISTKALAPSFEWWLGRNRPLNPYLRASLVEIMRREIKPRELKMAPDSIFLFSGHKDFSEWSQLVGR